MTYIIDWIEFDWDESIAEVMETLEIVRSVEEEEEEEKEYIRESILLTIDARIEEFKTSLIEDVREMMKEV